LKELIFGKNDTENIVSIHIDGPKAFLYKETGNEVECEVVDNKFWIVAAKYYNEDFRRLEGNRYYKYIKEYDDNDEFDVARQKSYKLNCWCIANYAEAAMIRQGLTYFKGMQVDDVSVLSFDIESAGLVQNADSKVFLITNTYKKKDKIIKKMFCLDDYDSCGEMIKDWCDWVREINPSVICGHNVLGYDLPYLAHCADMDGYDMELGRDGSCIEFRPWTSKFRKDGSQTIDYHDAYICGREIIDTMFLSIKYDIGRNFPSYGLKPIIKYLELEKEDRQHYDASKIAQNWNDLVEREKIKEYAKDDADDALELYLLMIPSYFYLNQSIPKTFQQIINTATGSQINSFMVRAYLQNGESLPPPTTTNSFEGAISMGIPGVYDNVRKVDVASLYPSIMRQYKIHNPKKDPHGYFLKTVEYFTEERLKNKKLAKDTGKKYYKDLEQSQKIVINSMYGFLGAPGLLFNSPDKAAEVTRIGREILHKGVKWATGKNLKQVIKNEGKASEKYEWVLDNDNIDGGKGYTLVNVDTDSFSYTNGNAPIGNEFDREIEDLNSIYPELIKWEDDGVYDKIIVVKAKNYVLKTGDKIKYKGSSLTDQKKEPALIELLHNMIDEILEGKIGIEVYNRYIKDAYNIEDINRWTTKRTVTKAVLESDRTNEKKVLNALVNEPIQEGDKVWLYAAIDGEKQDVAKGQPIFYSNGDPKMVPNCVLKLPKYWTGDEDKLHYVKRVYATITILENVLPMEMFTKYHLVRNQKLLEDIHESFQESPR
jgi:DNA polymerase elongation subunit (family B)